MIADLTMANRMSAEAFTTDVARSLRAASIARCAGSSGGFASYRRDPLGEAHREGRGLVTTFSTASRPALGAHAAPSGLAAGRSVVTLQTTMQSSTVWWDDARPVACGRGQRA